MEQNPLGEILGGAQEERGGVLTRREMQDQSTSFIRGYRTPGEVLWHGALLGCAQSLDDIRDSSTNNLTSLFFTKLKTWKKMKSKEL